MVRDYRFDDEDQIRKIHSNLDLGYTLPDLSSPLVVVHKVREIDGRVRGAMFLRITAETFLLVEGSPVEKARAIMELQPEVLREAYEKGLADIIAVIPPQMSDFGPVMEDTRLGWSRDREWPMYSRSTE